MRTHGVARSSSAESSITRIEERSKERGEAIRREIHARHPGLRRLESLAGFDDKAESKRLVLGRNPKNDAILIPERARLEHAHVIGTTGGGKTKFLQHCAIQDIQNGRGVCVVDPHGSQPDSLYRSLLGWLEREGYTTGGARQRTIHLIDPNAPTHVTGFDPLARPDNDYEPTVIADAAMEAFERLWNEENLNTKPTLQRVLSATLTALCELNLTLAEASLLYDPYDRDGIRAWALAHATNEHTREELQWLHDIASETRGKEAFRAEVTGPRNRIDKLTRTESTRMMVGQQGASAIDLRAALDEGHIILANLSGGPRASDQACQMLGRLLTRSLFFHAQRRRHSERPFFFYLDECQLYLSGDVSRILAEARKYGLGVTLAHQFLGQLEKGGEDIPDAVRNTTNLKVVFRLKDPKEAEDLAHMVVPLDLEMPVAPLVQPKVVGHRIRHFASESTSDQNSVTESEARTDAESVGTTESYIEIVSETFAEGESSVANESASTAEGFSGSVMSGSASGASSGQFTTAGEGLLDVPVVLGLSEGTSTLVHSAEGRSSSSVKGRNSGSAIGQNSTRATSTGSAWGKAVSHSATVAHSKGTATTSGTATTRGTQEGLEPVMADLPSAVHSMENMLYTAAQTLRNLTTGRAFINFVDHGGMRAALISVPNLRAITLSDEAFASLRAQVLEASPAATRSDVAGEHVVRRKRALMQQAATAQDKEPENPAGYRTKKKRPANGAGYPQSSSRGKPPLA